MDRLTDLQLRVLAACSSLARCPPYTIMRECLYAYAFDCSGFTRFLLEELLVLLPGEAKKSTECMVGVGDHLSALRLSLPRMVWQRSGPITARLRSAAATVTPAAFPPARSTARRAGTITWPSSAWVKSALRHERA
jgi:hypothetical protein